MNCYRVLVVDFRGNRWQPIIVAHDARGIAEKVAVIYPGGRVDESYVIHIKHSQWDIVFPEAPLVGAISGGASYPVERRRA